MTRALPALLAAVLATGCVATAPDTPSLLPRAIETRGEAEPVAAPAPAATPDPALDLKIGGLVADRTDAVTQFAADDRRLAGQLAAAKRAAVGSDAWLDAQTALASLEAGRSTVLGVLTDLEGLAAARATDGLPDYPALETARTETDAALDRINTVLAERKAGLTP